MSENLDLVRSIYADWERGDWSQLLEWAHPDVELFIADGPLPGRWSGPRAVADSWREFLGTWDGYRIEAEDYHELDGGRVLVFVRMFGRGKASGVDLGKTGAKGANVFCLRDGKVRKFSGYINRERALADLGLKE